MGTHPSGDGIAWDSLEAIDVDQPHGLDYQAWNHIAIAVRKRISQEHSEFGDTTAGGIHKPGGCAVLGMEITDDAGDPTALVVADGTYRGHGLVWGYEVEAGANKGILWCATAAAGASTTGDWTVMKLHPDLQWGGGDVTWAGAHEFDASVDFTGPIFVDGSADLSDVYIDGDITVKGNLKVATDFSLTGDMAVDGTSNLTGDVAFGADISVDATAVFGAKVAIEGDASGSQFPAAWAHSDTTTGTVHASYNIGNVDWSSTGIRCISFSDNLASNKYAIVFGSHNLGAALASSDNLWHCISQGVSGFRAIEINAADGAAVDDFTEFYFVVYI